MRSFPSHRVVITGAGSGLGRALALHFARDGWRVAVTDRDLESATATASEVRGLGGTALALRCDVSSDADVDRLHEVVTAEWQGVDVLVNNAGVAVAGTVEDTPLADWTWALDINLLGAVRICRRFLPLLTKQGAGHVVNVASFAGLANPPALAAYSASKAALISLSETLRFELAPHGVGVTVVCPSFFKTGLLKGGRTSAPQMGPIVQRLMARAPFTADDVAAAVYDAVLRDRFLVLVHKDERRRYWLKRASPELYYRIARKATAPFLRR
jgi:NAD(P)-dependent dehydrogenase (short-subunit alcohol dehydrogenase family)